MWDPFEIGLAAFWMEINTSKDPATLLEISISKRLAAYLEISTSKGAISISIFEI